MVSFAFNYKQSGSVSNYLVTGLSKIKRDSPAQPTEHMFFGFHMHSGTSTSPCVD